MEYEGDSDTSYTQGLWNNLKEPKKENVEWEIH